MASGAQRLILASGSPRRLDLLRAHGFNPRVRRPDVDETPQPGEDAAALVERLAMAKLAAVIDEAVNDPSYVEFLASKGEVPNVVKGEALGERLKAEFDALAVVSKNLGLAK